MPRPGETQYPRVLLGTIKAADESNRTVDVNYMGTDRGRNNVRVVAPPGNYSFPKTGDHCLIIAADEQAYCVGVVQFGYSKKLERGNVVDPSTGEPIQARLVAEGGIWFGNLVKRVWMSIAPSGDFSLMNGMNDGLKYIKQNRFLRLAGMALRLMGNGANVAFGSVYRYATNGSLYAVPSDLGPTIPAVEGLIDVSLSLLRIARLHLGYVVDANAIPETGSWGGRLRAILETAIAGVTNAALKIDEAGNIELSSSAAVVMFDGTMIQLGGLTAAQPVIKGTEYLGYESTFLGALNTFAQGVGTAAAGAVDPGSTTAAVQAIGALANTLATAVSTYDSARSAALSAKTMTS